jgi:hypothetical protein
MPNMKYNALFKRLRYLFIASLALSGCSGAQSPSVSPGTLAENSSTQAATLAHSRYSSSPATASPSSVTSDSASTKCIEGTEYTQSFSDNFSSFPNVNGVSGQWQTSYLWGRTNPGALDAAYYIDSSIISTLTQIADNITTIKTSGNGLNLIASKTPSNLLSLVANQPYVSGAINSSQLFSQTYGYFEATMTLPTGQGIWPAFWLLPLKGYPPEIDIMENLGNDPTHVYETTHDTSRAVQQALSSVSGGVQATHTYGVAWTSSSIEYFIDGTKVATQNNISNQPMYMVFNLAVGSSQSWPGAPSESTVFPATMQIQNVNAFALTSNPC